VLFTLPQNPAVGDIFKVEGAGQGGWKIAQNEGQSVAVPATGLSVTFAKAFYAVPAVAVTASDMATGEYAVISAKTAAGFNLQFRTSAGAGVARTADWIAKGFGYAS
jgi:hypothetical protein